MDTFDDLWLMCEYTCNYVSDYCQKTTLIEKFYHKFIKTDIIPPIGQRSDDYRFYEEIKGDYEISVPNPCKYHFFEWLDMVPDCEYERECEKLERGERFSFDIEATQIIHAARWIKANPGKEISRAQYFLEPHNDIDTLFIYQTPGL